MKIPKVVRNCIFALAVAEKLEEAFVGRKTFQGGKFQVEQIDMVAVNIDGRYRFGAFDQIIEGITAAGRDRQYSGMRIQFECLKIDPRVFPYLVIDEGVKPSREKLLQNSLF